MTVSLLIHLALIEIVLAFDSVPEFGNGIFDPVISSFESSDRYLSNDMVVPLLREDPAPIVIEELYEGYLFDENKCIKFNNRILCGYDKNKGHKLDDYTMVDMGGGCRSRGDRIECGYDRQVIKHRKSQVRQAPTRTVMTTNPQFILKNKIKTDVLEKKLLKSAFASFLMKSEDKSGIATATELESSASELPVVSETVVSNPPTHETFSSDLLSTTTFIPIELKSSASPKTQSQESTTEQPKTIISTSEMTSKATSHSKDILSDANVITKTVNLHADSDQNTTILSKILTTLPELVTESNSDTPGLLREPSTISATSNSPDLPSNISEDKIKTTCVEKNDRIVCYDFKA